MVCQETNVYCIAYTIQYTTMQYINSYSANILSKRQLSGATQSIIWQMQIHFNFHVVNRWICERARTQTHPHVLIYLEEILLGLVCTLTNTWS